ncbi:DUF3418 domain-containing protein, partial [Escherichia coli]|nr:DUF3418 domain-containing protein [Escherichia coli]
GLKPAADAPEAAPAAKRSASPPSSSSKAGGASVPAGVAEVGVASAPAAGATSARHTAWTFGELPELMEIGRMVGFPAVVDKGTHVEIEVFDEPEVAAARHRAGLRRLVALQIREPLKYLEKNLPDLQKMAVA